MTQITAPGQCEATASTKPLTIAALIPNKSSRLIPGLRGTPAGITTTSLPARHSGNVPGRWPVTVPGLGMCDKSEETPGVPRMSYRARFDTCGESWGREQGSKVREQGNKLQRHMATWAEKHAPSKASLTADQCRHPHREQQPSCSQSCFC